MDYNAQGFVSHKIATDVTVQLVNRQMWQHTVITNQKLNNVPSNSTIHKPTLRVKKYPIHYQLQLSVACPFYNFSRNIAYTICQDIYGSINSPFIRLMLLWTTC